MSGGYADTGVSAKVGGATGGGKPACCTRLELDTVMVPDGVGAGTQDLTTISGTLSK